jgi:hypothetical protein
MRSCFTPCIASSIHGALNRMEQSQSSEKNSIDHETDLVDASGFKDNA